MMNLHDPKAYAKLVGGFRAAKLHEQWEATVAKVGGKLTRKLRAELGIEV